MKTYLVSNTIDVSSMEGIEPLSIEDSISLIRSWPVVQFDTETTGLDARICKLTAMQFGYKDFKTGKQTAIVVDCLSINPEAYKYTIEHAYLIGQNLKFDLQFLYNHGIVPLQVYDTMICEQTLYLGYKPRSVSMSLASILLRHTGEEIDKSFQKVIAKKGLTEEGIRYAANDVVHLQDIRKSQLTIAESRNCKKAFIVENRFVPAIAYLEWCGVHLDEEKWKAKMARDKAVLDDCLDKLNRYALNNDKLQDFVSDYHEPSLFDNPDEEKGPYCTVDWASPAQCVPVFQALGFNTKIYDKVKKLEKDTVEEKIISLQKGIDDEFLKLYFDYKGAEKNVSTYGQGHLNQINPYTGRIHTIFNQIGTVTGRMSSGAGSGTVNKDLAKVKGLNPKEVGYCNLQNLPARGAIGKETRACFTSTGVNAFVSADYSAEESRVQADVWNEKSLLDSFANGIDTHNMYAKLCFPEELKDVDVRDVKKKRPDLRDKAKSAEFAIGYGSDGSAIAKSIGMPKEKAKEMVSNILKGMPGMANFKKKTIKFLKKHGYIIINETTGHRAYWPEWASWKAEEDRMDAAFFQEYRAVHAGTGDAVDRMVKAHSAKSYDWFNKNVLNYPIQGGSAVVLKQAAADLFEWVIKNGYFNKILFCVFVHDEIDCECPQDLVDEFSKVIVDIMQKAAGKFYKRLPIPSECSIGDHWIH